MPKEFIYSPPTEPWLDIVYEDRDIIVVNKPSGILTNPGRGEHVYDSIWARVKERHPLSHVVHRLDMATSGLLVLALRRKAEIALKRQFERRQVQKTYIAKVWGRLQKDAGEVDLPLICDWPRRPKQKVCFEHGKAAVTRYRVLSREGEATLVELTPITGRSHQLRVHMLSLGHPILGDGFYAHAEALAASDRLLLHASRLCFAHPYSGEAMEFNAPATFI